MWKPGAQVLSVKGQTRELYLRPPNWDPRKLAHNQHFAFLNDAYSSFFRANTNNVDASSRNITTPIQPFVARLPIHWVPTLNVSGFIHPASSSTLMTIDSRPMTPPAAINPLE